MLRTLNAQPTLWEAILPEMCRGMPAELEAVDRLLVDPAFFEPFLFGNHNSIWLTAGSTSPAGST